MGCTGAVWATGGLCLDFSEGTGPILDEEGRRKEEGKSGGKTQGQNGRAEHIPRSGWKRCTLLFFPSQPEHSGVSRCHGDVRSGMTLSEISLPTGRPMSDRSRVEAGKVASKVLRRETL